MKKIAFSFAALLLLMSCGDKINPQKSSGSEVVTTLDATEVSRHEARLFGKVDVSKLYDGVSVGVLVSTADNPTAENGTKFVAEEPDKEGKFYVDATGLGAGTAYSYRAFLNAGTEYWYGAVKQFTTEAPDSDEHNAIYKPVELGLSVKWASCNFRASSPEEYGQYCPWGETQPRTPFDWSTYKWCNGSGTTLTKYNTKSDYGTVDNKTVLDAEDDIIHATLGGGWHIPTVAEWQELMDNCTWEFIRPGGGANNCVKLTSKKNGESILLPCAGCLSVNRIWDSGSYGLYLSNALGDSPEKAKVFQVGIYGVSFIDLTRCDGYSLRPVIK